MPDVEDVPGNVRRFFRSKKCDGGCDIFADRGIDAVAGQEVYAAIRPEKIKIVNGQPAEARAQG